MTVTDVYLTPGCIAGLLLRLPLFDQPKGKQLFDDGQWWGTPSDFNRSSEAINGDAKPDKLLEVAATADEHV